jgi:hypothetical protein
MSPLIDATGKSGARGQKIADVVRVLILAPIYR